MFFCLFVFVFSTFGTFFAVTNIFFKFDEWPLSERLYEVTIKNNCVAGARRVFLVLVFPLHVKGFLGHQKSVKFSENAGVFLSQIIQRMP